MSAEYMKWARGVTGLKILDKLVLKTLAEKADPSGRYQTSLKKISMEIGVCRNTLRASLDRLADAHLLVFKRNKHNKTAAPAAHGFLLVRSSAHRRLALAQGYSPIRDRGKILDNHVVGQELTEGVGQDLTDGGSDGCPRVGQLFDPLINNSKSNSDISSCPNKVRTRHKYPQDFESFWHAYPTDANMSKSDTVAVWVRLDDVDKRDAAISLPAFKRYCAGRPDYRPLHAENYLKSRRWEGHMAGAIDGSAIAGEPIEPPADEPLRSIWIEIRKAMDNDQVFEPWFRCIGFERSDANAATLSFQTKFTMTWVRDHYGDTVAAAVKRVNPNWRNVTFVVRSRQAGTCRTPNAAQTKERISV